MNIELRILICSWAFFIAYFICDCFKVWKNYKERAYIKLKQKSEEIKITEKFTKVCQWRREHPNKGEYIEQLKNINKHPEFLSIHNDRYNITKHYQDIQECLDKGAITSNEFISLIPKNRAKILLNIIEPIEKEMDDLPNSDYNDSVFRTIEKYIKI